MKPIFHFMLLFAGLVFGISCKKDFLNITQKDILIRQDYVTDLATTKEFLTGIYPELGSYLYSAGPMIYPELIADNIKPVIAATGTTPYNNFYRWSQVADEKTQLSFSASAQNCNGVSVFSYKIILACNFAIEKTSQYRNQAPDSANVMRGQALAIRALAYFTLVNYFAQPYQYTPDASHPGVAITLTSDWTKSVNYRSTVADVYKLVIADLQEAVQLLPAGVANPLWMNRNAASGLLSRVYLSKGDYTAAKNLAVAVARNVPIMTMNYPAKLFTPEDKEVLFLVPPGVSATNNYITNFANSTFRKGQVKATLDIVTLLSENSTDQRKAWVTFVSTPAPGYWSITKYPSGATNDAVTDKANAYYQPIIRSSEMYLTAAECYAHLNNRDSALFYLNAIQDRAKVPLTAVTIPSVELLDMIYKERRKELAFEGLRMFDLLRWKKGVTRSDETDLTLKTLPYPSNKAVAPICALDVSLLGWSQNNDY
jgi:hypothetical protein